MGQTNRWNVVITLATLLVGLSIVSSDSHVARATTTFSLLGADIDGEASGDNSGASVAMSADGTRIAIGAIFNDDSGSDAGHVRVYTLNNGNWTQTGTDINGETPMDELGTSVAMSADGTRIAIGAPFNNGKGHVRVYTLNNGDWTQTGIDIDGEAVGDRSGSSVAMSADGTRIAIGAPFNNGSGTSGSTDDTGHVRVYTLNNGDWTQTGTDIDGEAAGDNSGSSVAMSGDGTRIAIGAPLNNGSGHVRVYTLNNGDWTQTGPDIDGEAAGDASGYSVAMSTNGSRIAIGAPYNNGKGHARVYNWNGTAWTQTGPDIDGEAAGDNSGYSVAMSGDGTRIAIGAPFNNGKGHARVYTLNNGTWTQTGTDIDGEAAGDASGYSVAMSTNGSRIAIGALWNDNNSADIGHVRVYAVLATPAAPTISSVSAADGSFTVAFTPGTDGGSPIMNYKYSIDGTNYIALNPAATTSPFTVSGLTNGTTYSVTIKAVNGLGDSPTSNVVIGTPVAPAATTTTAPTTTVAPATTTTTAPTTTVAPATTTTTAPTTAAPSTTIATIITASVNKVIETNGDLPKTGSNSSPLMTFATILLSAGLVIVTRRRITS